MVFYEDNLKKLSEEKKINNKMFLIEDFQTTYDT